MCTDKLICERFSKRCSAICVNPSPAQHTYMACLLFKTCLASRFKLPKRQIHETFSVYLCSDESATARKQAAAGSNSSYSSLPMDKGVIKLTEPKGAIVVVRKDECYAEMRRVFNPGKQAAEMSAVAAAVFGPDEFITDIVGPELLALTQQHMGRCVYKFPFEVSLPGPFRLAIKVLRANYTALDEIHHATSHPPMHFDDVLGSKTWLMFLANGHLGKRSVEDLIEGEGLQWCAAGHNAEKKGRWISRFGDGNGLFLSKAMPACPKAKNGERKPSFRAGGSGRLWHIDYTQLSWSLYECKERFFRPEEASECLASKSILFSGDSHMRTFFNSVVKYSCGVPDAAQKGHHTSQCHVGGGNAKCPGGVYCLEHNMLGWMDALHLPERWDWIIANVGHHPAAGAEHWTMHEYRAHVEAFLDAIRDRLVLQTTKAQRGKNSETTKFVWMASHAMPTARDNQIVNSGDWRTNQRLALYEKYARDRFMQIQKELGSKRVMYQDAYNLTLPLIEAAAGDCGHFLPANIQMALVQQFLNLVCPMASS